MIARLILALVVACTAPACGDGDCRSRDECGSGEFCAGPNGGPACGIAPREECSDDQQCINGTCHAIDDSCSFDGIGSACRAACTGDTDCGTGFRCNADGACEAVPCDDGFDCPVHQACDPAAIGPTTPVFDRHHGCVNVSCSGDSDCDDGLFCVNEICQTGVGSCQVPMNVP